MSGCKKSPKTLKDYEWNRHLKLWCKNCDWKCLVHCNREQSLLLAVAGTTCRSFSRMSKIKMRFVCNHSTTMMVWSWSWRVTCQIFSFTSALRILTPSTYYSGAWIPLHHPEHSRWAVWCGSALWPDALLDKSMVAEDNDGDAFIGRSFHRYVLWRVEVLVWCIIWCKHGWIAKVEGLYGSSFVFVISLDVSESSETMFPRQIEWTWNKLPQGVFASEEMFCRFDAYRKCYKDFQSFQS